jgi:molybdenum cofactor cytidylyltransferase
MTCAPDADDAAQSRLRVGGVLLAAGESYRMGGRPKALLQLEGVPLIRRNLNALSGARVEEIVAVLGHRAEEVESALRDLPVTVVQNPDYARGRMSSLNVGLAALPQDLDAIVVALADQPLIEAQDITVLIAAFGRCRDTAAAVVPYVDGARGNPIILDVAVRTAVLAGNEYAGCREWLDAHPGRVVSMATTNRHYSVDIDTFEDMETFATTYGCRLDWPPDRGVNPRD